MAFQESPPPHLLAEPVLDVPHGSLGAGSSVDMADFMDSLGFDEDIEYVVYPWTWYEHFVPNLGDGPWTVRLEIGEDILRELDHPGAMLRHVGL